MAQVISFVHYTPAPRYDGVAWTAAEIQEATAALGATWTTIDTHTLSPVDADPAHPQARDFTTDDASDTLGLWYRIVWLDASGAFSPTFPVQNEAPEQLSPTALCTEEDVRKYLNIKAEEMSEEDRDVLIRLVNAASQTFTDESQRLWKLDPAYAGQPRLYRLDAFDVSVGRLRIDDCTAITSVSVSGFRYPLVPTTPVAAESWWPWQEEPGYPISAIVFAAGLLLESGQVVQVDASWGWPVVPDKVRQSVIYTAAEWYARDVEKFSATFSLDQGRILMPQVLPAQVQREAESYRRWRVA